MAGVDAPAAGGRDNARPESALHRTWRITEKFGLHEVVVVVISFLVYFLIRGSVVSRVGDAMVRGFDVIRLEQHLGFYWELTMQGWIINHYWLIKIMNWIYFWGHMPLIIVFAVWLWIWHRHTYTLMRNAFLASGAIGVIVYWLFPVAPPRLIPFGGFTDTMAVFDKLGYDAQETKAFVNEFASVPSLHFGWSMLIGLAVFWVGRQWWLKAFGVVWPIAMFFSVIMTGNHFIFDAITGAIVCLIGLWIAWEIDRWWPRFRIWSAGRWQARGSPAITPHPPPPSPITMGEGQ